MIVNMDFEVFTPENMPEVQIEVRALELGAYQEIARMLPRIIPGDITPEKVGEIDPREAMERLGDDLIAKTAASVLPKHVGAIKGIQLRQGEDLRTATVEDLLKYGAFLPLNLALLMHLFQISSVSETEAKN